MIAARKAKPRLHPIRRTRPHRRLPFTVLTRTPGVLIPPAPTVCNQLIAAMACLGGYFPKVMKCLAIPLVKLSI